MVCNGKEFYPFIKGKIDFTHKSIFMPNRSILLIGQ